MERSERSLYKVYSQCQTYIQHILAVSPQMRMGTFVSIPKDASMSNTPGNSSFVRRISSQFSQEQIPNSYVDGQEGKPGMTGRAVRAVRLHPSISLALLLILFLQVEIMLSV